MKVKDFDDFRTPNRKPWLLFLVIAIAAAIALHHFLPRKPAAEKEKSPPVERGSEAEAAAAAGEQEPDVPASVDDVELLKQAKQCEADKDLPGARRRYLALLDRTGNNKIRSEAEIRLGAVNVELVTTPWKMAEKTEYIVKKGDSVLRIAGRFGTTVELIQKSNRLKNPHLIRPGDRFMILQGKFAIHVRKSHNDVRLTLNDTFFKRYSVGTGEYGKTPIGTFVIKDKQKEPVWWHPSGKEIPYGDPENILGTRWMAIQATGDTPPARGYGIHGTWDESSIGKAVSAGCIRMRNKDVEELYMLVPLGTPVTIEE